MRAIRASHVFPAILALAGLVGCGTDPAGPPVAFLDSERLTLSELELYLATNLILGGDDPPLSHDEQNQIKSRLFDSFLEERMLLLEAERSGVEVSEAELDAYLGSAGAPGEAPSAADRSRRRAARNRLMIRKLQQTAARNHRPDEDEIESYVRSYLERSTPKRRLLLRSLTFDSLDDARRVGYEIGEGSISFDQAAARLTVSSEVSRPGVVAWETLAPEIRSLLQGIETGQISAPLELHGNAHLFQIESWLDDPDEDRRRALEELESSYRRQAYREMIGAVRQKTRIRLELRNLPFGYQSAPSA